jgi:hypothetical protein
LNSSGAILIAVKQQIYGASEDACTTEGYKLKLWHGMEIIYFHRGIVSVISKAVCFTMPLWHSILAHATKFISI